MRRGHLPRLRPTARRDRLAEHFARTTDPAVAVLLDDPTAGILLLDGDGRVVRANAALRAMVGAAADHGAHGSGVLTALGQDQCWPGLDSILRGQSESLAPCRGLVGDPAAPELHPGPHVSIGASPLRDADGSVGGAIVRITDITAQRRLEAQLAQGRRLQALGHLAGGVAHDFNNLLTVVLGAADAIQDRATDEQTRADAMLVADSARRGAALVRQLLAFGRQQQLQPRALVVNTVVSDLATLMRRLLGSHITLSLDLEQPGRLVRADPAQLDQVLMNLATNARDAMPEGGTLTLRTGHITLFRPLNGGAEPIPPGRYVMIEVRDTGGGIAPEVLPRIFEPFFTTRRDRGGTGLGLSTVHGIIRQSGGFIGVDSGLGTGTRMRLYLPRWDGDADPAAPTPSPPAPATSVPTPRGRVLLVEDEEPVRRLAERALRRAGWDVVAADCADAALHLMETERPRLAAIVTDMVMPGLDGAALVRTLRDRLGEPGLPAILVSGYAEAALRRDATETQAVFLAKPYALAELTATLLAIAG